MASDDVVSKIYHTAPYGFHCTRPGVSYGAVVNQFIFESVLLSSEEETDEGGHSALLWVCSGGWGWLISNEELDVPES